MSLLDLPDELIGGLFEAVADKDPRDAVALGITCRRLLVLAAASVSHFHVDPVFPVTPFHPSHVRPARRRVAAVARVLAAALRVQHVSLRLRDAALRDVDDPPAARQRRRAEAELLFARLLGVVGFRPVQSLTVDAAVVRLVLPGVPVSTPVDALRELAMVDLAVHPGTNDGATTLLQLCGGSLRRLTMVDRPKRGRSYPFTASAGSSMHRWFGGAASMPALMDLTIQAELHEETTKCLASVCPAVQCFSVSGHVSHNALKPLRLPAWPRLSTLTIRYAEHLPVQPTGIVELLLERALEGELRVEKVDWANTGDVAHCFGAEEVARAVEGMRQPPSRLVVDIPEGADVDALVHAPAA